MPKAVNYDIVIEQRATFTQTFTYTDASGNPIDLSFSTARMQVRRQGTGILILELTTNGGGIVLGGTAGTITLIASASLTATLPTGNFVYSVELTTGNVVNRLIQGKCAIKTGVTVIADPAPDTTAPSVPTGLALTVQGSDRIDLSWAPSIDPIVFGQARSGLAGYRVYQDGFLVYTVASSTTYTATSLLPATDYTFQVSAFDLAGNESDLCAAVTATTAVVPDGPDITAPTVPANLTLTVLGATHIDLSWDASSDPSVLGEVRSGMAGYKVFKDGSLLSTVTVGTAYSANGLTADTLYSFRVSALDVAGNESAQCAAVTATTDAVTTPNPDVTPPTVPTGLAVAVISTTQLDLTWNASTDPTVANEERSGLAGYEVFQDTVLVATLGVVTTYSATGLTAGTLYSFRVLAFDAATNASAQCTAVTGTTKALDMTAPSVPTGLALTVRGTSTIDLDWAASSDPTVGGAITSGLAGYKVYKDGSLLDTLSTVLTYSATGLTASTLYSFRVSAYDIAGNESAQCAAQTATTDAAALNPDTTPPSVPTSLTLVVASTTQIDLTWAVSTDPTVGGDTRSGLAGYKVYKDGSLLATLSGVTAYSATGLTPGTLYSFRVSAYDVATNESAQCVAVTATTLALDTTAPSVPTGLALAVTGTTTINLSWNASSDATVGGAVTSGLAGYKVYKDGSLLATLDNVLTYGATGLTASTLYSFRVSSYDVAGNESAQCTAVTATTDANPLTSDVTAPSVPTSLTPAVISTSQINLSWVASTDPTVPGAVRSGLAGYKVYKDGSLLATLGLVTSYSATGLSPNTTYSFRVSAFDAAANESAQCAAQTAATIANPDTTAPTVPTNLALGVVSASVINLTWSASTDPTVAGALHSGLVGYKVYRNNALLATLGLVTTYSATNLAPTTTYTFTVSAIDAAGNESAQSAPKTATTSANPDTTAPSVPTGLTATAVSTSQINLTWVASTDPTVFGQTRSGLTGYKVYKDGVLLATLGLVTSYSATGLTANTLYSFTILAFDAAANESAQSAAQSATTLAVVLADTTPPTVPTGLALAVISTSQINLSWAASTDPVVPGATTSGVSGYKVYKDGSLLATLGLVTSYSATGLSAGTSYSFRVSALDAATNESAQCTAVAATTSVTADTTAPTVPTGLAAVTVSSTRIDLAWSASTDPTVAGQVHSGLAGYKVYKNGVLLATLGLVTTYSAIGLARNTSYSFQVSAIDAAGNESAQSGAQSATTAANSPPVFSPSLSSFTVLDNTTIGTVVADLSNYVSDADGDPLTVTMTGSLPAGLTYDSTTKKITVTSTLTAGAPVTVTFTADDGYSSSSSDWIARSTAPGVIWSQLFESAAAVNAYRWTNGVGFDPSPAPGSVGSYVRWNATDGILRKGCLELEQLTNGNMSSYWWKPFNPAFTPPAAPAVWTGAGGDRFAGQGFYVQLRVKTNCGGGGGSTGPNGGIGGGGRKVFSASRTENSYTFQECVVQDTNYRGVFQMYQGKGSSSTFQSFEVPAGGSDFNFEPGSAFANPALTPAYCSYQAVGSGNRTNCWLWGNNEWITYLLHVIPGNEGVANQTAEVWAWKPGMPDYVLIMRRTDLTQHYDLDKNAAYNALLLWIYETGRTSGPAGQKQWYDQVIYSTSTIARPTDITVTSNPVTFTIAAASVPGIPAYVSSAPLGQWSKINTNTAASAKFPGWGSGGYPVQSDALYNQLYDVWTGSAYDPTLQRMYFHGGAHGSYSGNEFYYFDLTTGLFGRVNDPGPYTLPSSGDPVAGLMPDGLPMVIHTYGTIVCDANGTIYRLSNNASPITTVWKFNPKFAANPMPYSSAGTLSAWTNTGAIIKQGLSDGYVWDTVNQTFYGGTNNSGFFTPRSYKPSTNAYSIIPFNGFPNGFAPDLDASVGLDTSRRLMYVVGGGINYNSTSFVNRGTIVYNIGTNAWTELTPLTTGAKTPESSQAGGLTYDSRRDKMVYYLGKLPSLGQFYTFDYTTKVWTLVTPSGPTPPVATVDGVYSKFKYIPAYDVFVLCSANSTSGTVEMWMYKPSNWMA